MRLLAKVCVVLCSVGLLSVAHIITDARTVAVHERPSHPSGPLSPIQAWNKQYFERHQSDSGLNVIERNRIANAIFAAPSPFSKLQVIVYRAKDAYDSGNLKDAFDQLVSQGVPIRPTGLIDVKFNERADDDDDSSTTLYDTTLTQGEAARLPWPGAKAAVIELYSRFRMPRTLKAYMEALPYMEKNDSQMAFDVLWKQGRIARDPVSGDFVLKVKRTRSDEVMQPAATGSADTAQRAVQVWNDRYFERYAGDAAINDAEVAYILDSAFAQISYSPTKEAEAIYAALYFYKEHTGGKAEHGISKAFDHLSSYVELHYAKGGDTFVVFHIRHAVDGGTAYMQVAGLMPNGERQQIPEYPMELLKTALLPWSAKRAAVVDLYSRLDLPFVLGAYFAAKYYHESRESRKGWAILQANGLLSRDEVRGGFELDTDRIEEAAKKGEPNLWNASRLSL